MSAALEPSFISAVLLEGEMAEVIEARITGEFFTDDESREVWEWVLGFWGEYGEVPTSAALKRHFPTYKLFAVEDPLDYFTNLMVKQHQFYLAQEGIMRASTLLQDDRDTQAALAELAQTVSHTAIVTSRSTTTNLTETLEDRLNVYREIRENPGLVRGIPLGFPTLDEALGGLEPGQLITMTGPPKAGKSTLLLQVALNAHRAGQEIAFVGFEMSNREQELRRDAMVAHVSHQKLKSGTMTDKEFAEFERRLREYDEQNPHPFNLIADVSSTTTPLGISNEIQKHHPGLVLIDGTYLMDDDRGQPKGSPQALTNITRDLKRLAQRWEIPILNTTQSLEWKMSKKGFTGSEIGYTSSFLQDSDVIIGALSKEGSDYQKVLSIARARNAPPMTVIVNWDWETAEFCEFEGEERTMAVKERANNWTLSDDDIADDDDVKPTPRIKRRIVR